MSFPLLLIAKCDSGAGEFEGKNIEKQLRISIRRRDKKNNVRVSKHDGGESWKHNRVPFPLLFLHAHTHACPHVFVETHP